MNKTCKACLEMRVLRHTAWGGGTPVDSLARTLHKPSMRREANNWNLCVVHSDKMAALFRKSLEWGIQGLICLIRRNMIIMYWLGLERCRGRWWWSIVTTQWWNGVNSPKCYIILQNNTHTHTHAHPHTHEGAWLKGPCHQGENHPAFYNKPPQAFDAPRNAEQ